MKPTSNIFRMLENTNRTQVTMLNLDEEEEVARHDSWLRKLSRSSPLKLSSEVDAFS